MSYFRLLLLRNYLKSEYKNTTFLTPNQISS